MTQAFILFHLNLAYSSIAESARPQVIERCYYPLLELARKNKLPIGIELTSWTLQQIQNISPDWVTEFKRLISLGQCELIGSGYTQLIGPLVPYAVNVWNQKIGLADYQRILGITPKLALINEMVFSTGLVDIYQNSGYQGIIMDRDNIRLALGLENEDYESVPSHAKGLNNTSLPVLWSDSILFQKLQRYAHGDSRLIDYLSFFKKRVLSSKRPLAIYCNDAEIFDYRPGRYREERPAHQEGEWRRLERLLNTLSTEEKVQWLSPSEALTISLDSVVPSSKILSSINQPIPVKKQAKYNVSRWAVTGRNDLWINTLCHRLMQKLQGSQDVELWRRLCELWASDLRTHIETGRWEKAQTDLKNFAKKLHVSLDEDKEDVLPQMKTLVLSQKYFKITYDPEGILLTIKSPQSELILNLRRGLTLHSLAFASQDFVPLVGTLPHGYFDSIQYGVDFYSAGVIIEFPTEHRRVTDLERVEPIITQEHDQLYITAHISTDKGIITKQYVLSGSQESLYCSFEFPQWQRSHNIVRAGILTLLPKAFSFPLSLETCNGGSALEAFTLDRSCDHTLSSSSLVSCTTGFGATTGEIVIGDPQRKLKISWNPSKCAVFPMLLHQVLKEGSLIRLFFSLSELDETTKAGGVFPSFRFNICPLK